MTKEKTKISSVLSYGLLNLWGAKVLIVEHENHESKEAQKELFGGVEAGYRLSYVYSPCGSLLIMQHGR
jgi:hypothetical protein